MKRIKDVVLLILLCIGTNVFSQSETFNPGSYIVNMGSATQTVGNGVKPYGLVYELLKTYKVPVKWVIKAGKAKDAKDFTYGGTDYKGGTFIIPKEYISVAVANRISVWEGLGVIGTYTASSLTLTVTETLTSVPNWTLNNGNIAISQSLFTAAGIPSSAYNNTDPASLGACNDIFVLPHATPTWAAHGNLYNWNKNNKGAIWSGCHAVSLLENLVNPADTTQKLNFLSTRGLMDFNSHADGSVPFKYFFNRASYHGAPISARADDEVFQMIGIEDAAHTNGSEQIYIPKSGSAWRNTTHIGCYDSIQSNVNADAANGPAALTLYGRGHGLSTSGLVMYQSGHDIEGSGTANVSAMRQFFNFSFAAMKDKVPVISGTSIPSNIVENYAYNVSVSASSPVGSSLSYLWSASCAGTFANAYAASTIFTPANIDSNATYTISCVVTDACARYTFMSASVTGLIPLPLSILKFEAKPHLSDIVLSWLTAAESTVDHYEIFRSLNGRDFNSLGENIKAIGNTNEINTYGFTDLNSMATGSNLYYKLQITDKDGQNYHSHIVQVKTGVQHSTGNAVSVFPNPAGGLVHIELQHIPESDYVVRIIDAYGRLVKELNNPETDTGHTIVMDTEQLEKGIYFIHIIETDGMVYTTRFIRE